MSHPELPGLLGEYEKLMRNSSAKNALIGGNNREPSNCYTDDVFLKLYEIQCMFCSREPNDADLDIIESITAARRMRSEFQGIVHKADLYVLECILASETKKQQEILEKLKRMMN